MNADHAKSPERRKNVAGLGAFWVFFRLVFAREGRSTGAAASSLNET